MNSTRNKLSVALVAPVILLLFAPILSATEIFVPDDHPTIQLALAAAADGDIITVRAGTYSESIDFLSKAVTLRSQSGAAMTVIDGSMVTWKSVVTFNSGESAGSILEGFTITNGSGISFEEGGGIYCGAGTAPVIRNNIITHNGCYNFYGHCKGGGVYCQDSSATILNNVISFNSFNCSSGWGGGIFIDDGEPTIDGNVIHNNSLSTIAEGSGGGIYCGSGTAQIHNNLLIDNYCGASPGARGGGIYCGAGMVTNNTVYSNECDPYSGRGGGIFVPLGATAVLTNNIVRDNWAPKNPELSGGDAQVTYCNVKGGWPGTGNIDADPLFADSGRADFHLTYGSPCRDAGTNLPSGLPDTDFEGDPRIADGTADIGCDEFHLHLYVQGAITAGANIYIKVIGSPQAGPVMLAEGSGILVPPLTTSYGTFYLATPLLGRYRLGSIPANGVLSVTAGVPPHWLPGEPHPFQALVGSTGNPNTKLTNLMVMRIE